MAAFNRAELEALGYVERMPGHWEKVQGLGVLPPNSETGLRHSPAPAYRSKWDADRAALLETLKHAGQIAAWKYESIRLRLGDGAWYKPDFLVVETDGTLTLEEVKGHWREAALVRYKVARSMYPMFAFRPVTKRGGQWVDAMEGKR